MSDSDETREIEQMFGNFFSADALLEEGQAADLHGVGPNDLIPCFLDMKLQEQMIRKQMRPEKEDYSAKFKEYVDINQAAAWSLDIHVDPEDILAGLSEPDILPLDPSGSSNTTNKENISGGGGRKRKDTGNDDITVISINPKRERRSESSRKDLPGPNQQLVFVFNTITKEKKFLTLRKGQDPPHPFEVISFDNDAVPILSNQFDLVSSPAEPAPVTSKLNSLSDLMTASTDRQAQSEAVKDIPAPTVVPAPKDPVPIVKMVPAQPAPVSKQLVPKPKQIVVVSKLGPTSKSASATTSIVPAGYISPPVSVYVLSCKFCGTVFPYHKDDMYRRHMFIKHQLEVGESNFMDSRMQTEFVLQCKKCKDSVLFHVSQHLAACSPELKRDQAFDKVSIAKPFWQKCPYTCGVNGCTQVFAARYELRSHLVREHNPAAGLMILDPFFRCAKCLKRFDESISLGQHVTNCEESGPTEETILELSRSLLNCDFCGLKHASLSDTTSCYLNRSVFRCVLCFHCSRSKPTFYKHLHTYHGLKLVTSPQMMVECPMCDHQADKYTVIFPHIVTEHYGPALQTAKLAASPLRRTSSDGNDPLSKAITPYKGGAAGSARKLELRFPTSSTSNVLPPGIIINTSRIQQAGHGIILRGTTSTISSASGTPNNVIALRQPGLPISIKPMITNGTNHIVVNKDSPAMREPMSGIFKQAPKAPQIGVMRPVVSLSTTPTILRNVRPAVSSISQQQLPTTVTIQNGSTTSTPQLVKVTSASSQLCVRVVSTPSAAKTNSEAAFVTPATTPTSVVTKPVTTSSTSNSSSSNQPTPIATIVSKSPESKDHRVVNIGGRQFQVQYLESIMSNSGVVKTISPAPINSKPTTMPKTVHVHNPLVNKSSTLTKTPTVSISHKQSSSGLSFSTSRLPNDSTFRVPSLPMDPSPRPAVASISLPQEDPNSNADRDGDA